MLQNGQGVQFSDFLDCWQPAFQIKNLKKASYMILIDPIWLRNSQQAITVTFRPGNKKFKVK